MCCQKRHRGFESLSLRQNISPWNQALFKMSYLVFARKYRPQTFDQVIKQDHITRTLTNAISSGRVHHAPLFSGPRGTGKTTVARILAKAMNCIKGSVPVPCNECRSCVEITSGSSIDVFEIDGASNNSVDQIRELRENIKYMPAYSRFKIYIIDEVHMLSMAAFNALLKTLEEPPDHAMFIFATTEPQKIPVTILSRCQRYDFRRIDIESLSGHMKNICDKEGVEISPESLFLIGREAGGSMRDALSLLDQIISCAQGAITHDYVLDMLGILDRKVLFDLSGAVLSKDACMILDILDQTYSRGHDMKKLHTELIEHFRNLLIVKMGKKINKLIDLPANEIDLMVKQVSNIPIIQLNRIFDILFKEEFLIRQTRQPKLVLEMMFIKLLQIKPVLPIDMLIEKLDNLKKDFHTIHTDHTDHTDTTNIPAENIADVTNGSKSKPKGSVRQASTPDETKPSAEKIFDPDGNYNQTWEKFVDIIAEEHPSLAASLTNCALQKLTDQKLEIEAGTTYNLNVISRNDNMSIIKKTCMDFFGKKLNFIINTKSNLNDQNLPGTSNNGRLKKKALNNPLVADAIEVFNGKILDVKIL